MGAVADAALAAGGKVVGVLPRSMTSLEPPHYELIDQVGLTRGRKGPATRP